MSLRWTGRRRADHDRWVLLIKYIGVRHASDEIAAGRSEDMAA